MELSPACAELRLALSARRDGLTHEHEGLDAHLTGCADCAAFERELVRLGRQWSALEHPQPPADLWLRIDASLAPAPRRRSVVRRALLQAAAALLGFFGTHAVARALSAPAAPRAHLLTRWFVPPAELEDRARLAAAPELQLLRTLSDLEEER